MENVAIETTDDEIIIKIDRTFKEWKSGSGKSLMLASTEGNQKIEGTDFIIGLNCYSKIRG